MFRTRPAESAPAARRLLLLSTTTGYQTRAFLEAAEKLGLEVVIVSDRCHVLENPWQDGAIAVRFEDAEDSARRIVERARSEQVVGVVALGDRAVPAAARAAQALGLPFHPPDAAEACRDKSRMRERLGAAGLPVPAFTRCPLDADPRAILSSDAPPAEFPCVLKPLALSASRGVIRANTPEEFVAAFDRIRALLLRPEVRVLREAASDFIQVEDYIEGIEVAVEALVERCRLQVLAVFDKPDPLTGPFFEETMYVTPTRLPQETQASVLATLECAVRALGLHHGPLHAEMRLNDAGVWPLEIAARSIGGLCSRALRFRAPETDRLLSLEEIIIRLALGEDVSRIRREERASGVMMIPVPARGVYGGVEGENEALRVPGVEEILITAQPQQKLEPLPEGSSYLGFIFARGDSPAFIEHGLREAHGKLRFRFAPAMPVVL